MTIEPMPEWEDNLRHTFGNRQVTVHRYQSNVISLHKAIEAYTGEKYRPPKKPLEDKILDILKHHDDNTEWDSKTIVLHLFFFHKHTYNRVSISRVLKKLAAKGTLIEVSRGVYKKAGTPCDCH